MNKETIKAFIAWLEASTDEEIKARQAEILSMSCRISTRDGRSDFNLAMRLIDEEIIARLDLRKLKR